MSEINNLLIVVVLLVGLVAIGVVALFRYFASELHHARGMGEHALRDAYVARQAMLTAEADRIHGVYERVLNKQVFGGTPLAEAEFHDRDTDPVSQLRGRVAQQTRETVTEKLRGMYAENGLRPTDAELDAEVDVLLGGGTIEPPASLRAFVRE